MNQVQKNILIKHSITVLTAYAGSENAEPQHFQEVVESAYDAMKALLEHSKKN